MSSKQVESPLMAFLVLDNTPHKKKVTSRRICCEQELVTVVPCFKGRADAFSAELLLALLEDLEDISRRMLALKQLYPTADLFPILRARHGSKTPMSCLLSISLDLNYLNAAF